MVDDHGAVREGIRALLEAEPDIVLVGAVADARSALSLSRDAPAEVAVLDHHLPDEDGLTLCLRLKCGPRPPRVLLYSGFADDHLAVRAVVAGADALLPKETDPDELPRLVRSLARGDHRRPLIGAGPLRAAGSLLDPEDLPILGMLVHRTDPGEIADALGMSRDLLHDRRGAMLDRLQR